MRNTQAVADALRLAGSIAIVCHVNPDGDAIGSSLAMKLGLEQLGKQVSVFNSDKVPDNLWMLRDFDTVRTPDSLAQEEVFDLCLVVDVADEGRMGSCNVLLHRAKVTAQLDHHSTNPDFCQVNAVDGTASAAGLLVFEVLKMLGVTLNRDICKCLYTAISTDTGNFAFDNTTAEAFRVMGELMEHGLPLREMNRHLFLERDAAQVLLLQRALASLRFSHKGEVASMMLTHQDFEDCGALPEHADTIVSYAASVRGVKLSVLARDAENGVKVSLRAVAPYQVNGIATSHGGGGHAQASGCTMQGELHQVCDLLTAEMCAYLDA